MPTSLAVTTGTISGTVRTSGGNPISGATVSASVYSATTASDGSYSILNVPAGAGYTVTASKTGYLDVTAANVTVTAGNTTLGVDFSLNSAGGGNSSISSNTATFDKNSANTSTGHYADIPVTVTFNGNTLLSIANGSIPLIENTDYTVSESVYSISKTYLASQSIGTTTAYDPDQVPEGEFPAMHYYDETLGRWIKLETELVQEGGRWYAVTRVNHLTRFTVFSVTAEPEEKPVVEKQTITLTIGRIQASVDGSPYTLDAALRG